ncbi:MAG: IS4 family transposase [Planctomycetia bacterium]|nr:IS4 family transposase [Planctomycetia bacterium]
MSTQSIVGWVVCVTSNLLPRQSATLAALVAAAIRCERVNLATVGRKMAGAVAAKHTIKRAWRFTCNRRVEVADAMTGVVKRLARRRTEPLVISSDWTDVRGFHTLLAAACIGGRAVPLLWASYTGSKLRRSQNSPEERLLRKLRGLIPGSVPVIVLADRGFGRAEWAAVCQELNFRYVVAIKPDVTVSCPRYRGVLRKYPARKGMAHVPRGVDYRKDRRVKHNVVVRWKPDLPKKRDEPWYLMTDLDGRAERLCDLYGRRMSVEELFRDHKGRRNGQSPRDTRISHPDRFDRFLIVVALAYLVLVGAGPRAKLDHDPSAWCTTRRARECSVFTTGKAMIDRLNCPPYQLLKMIRWATIDVGSKWG